MRAGAKSAGKRRTAEDKMRAAARDRDGEMCQLETASGRAWIACKRRATQAAHVYRRREAGPAKYDQDVVVMACEPCHTIYDNDARYDVRVRPEHEERAWEAIVKAAKKAPPPPRQSLTGQRL